MLPEKKEFLRSKNSRFTALKRNFIFFSLGGLIFYTALFAVLSVWQMALLCGISLVLCVGVFLLYRSGLDRPAFVAGVLLITIFALAGCRLLGWQTGFFLLVLAPLPLLFFHAHLPLVFRFSLTGLMLGAGVLVFVLSWWQGSVWLLSEDFVHLLQIINLVLTAAALAAAGLFFGSAASDAEKALIHANKKLANLSSTDPVTNLVNRRIIVSRIEQEQNRMERGNKPFCLILIDVDDFSGVNDKFGFSCGDYIMAHLAEVISRVIRKQDEVARWGGDEFMLMLPETDIEGGKTVAQKIRAKILKTPFMFKETKIPITVTLGVGVCEKETGVGSCIHKADHALHLGKYAGKNRVSIFQET
jgi:diguanylate cyclase (GGDEF)-like protein